MTMDDATLERRLRDTYAAVGEMVDIPAPSVALLEQERGGGHGRGARDARRRVPIGVAAFAVVLVVAVAVAVAVALNGSSSDRGHRPGVAPATGDAPELRGLFPTYPNHQGAPLLLAPTYVPEGFHLVESTQGDGPAGGGGSPGGTLQFWVRLDAAEQQPLASFTLSWAAADLAEQARQSGFPPDPGRHGDALDRYRSESVPFPFAGHDDALYSEARSTIAWEQDGQIVTVAGGADDAFGAWPEHLSRDDLQRIAEHLVREPDGRYTLTDPPAGFRFSGEQPSFAFDGTNERVLAYSDGTNHGFAIQLVDHTEVPPGVKLANPRARLVQIRGQRAVLTPFLNGGPGCTAADRFLCEGPPPPGDVSHLSVIWTEPDGTRVVVTSARITRQHLLDIANGLAPVRSADWPQVAGAPGGVSSYDWPARQARE